MNNRGCQPTENEKNKHTTLKGLNKVKLKRFMKHSLKNTNPMKKIFPIIFLSTLLISQILPAQSTQKPIYKDSTAPIESRIKDLLGRMTLAEKCRQIDIWHPKIDVSNPEILSKTIAALGDTVKKWNRLSAIPGSHESG